MSGSVPDGRTSIAPLPSQLLVHRSTSLDDRRRQLALGDAHVLLRLRPARHHAPRLAQLAALERRAEQQRGGEAVAGDVVTQVDDVPRLLAAEDRPPRLRAPRARSGRRRRSSRRGCRALASARGSRVRHHRHGDVSTSWSSARIATIWSPSTARRSRRPRASIAVAVERDAEVEPPSRTAVATREVGRTAADVDVRAVRRVTDGTHLGPHRSNACGASPATRRSHSPPRCADP